MLNPNMKKFLLSFTLSTAFAMPLLADNPLLEPVVGDYGDGFDFIPSVFSYDGKTQLFIEDEDGFAILDSDFRKSKTILTNSSSVIWPYYNNPELLAMDETDVPLTQTLFNSDSHYEYMVEVRESDLISGFKIVNDEGRILQAVSYPQGFGDSNYVEVNVWNINEEYFLIVNTMSNDMLVYKINRSDSGTPLTYSGKMKSRMAVSPRAARRSMPVTVSLDGDADYSDVQLVDESGRTVMSMPVNGQTSVVIETSSLRSGMYIVRATGDSGEHEACKIIIR